MSRQEANWTTRLIVRAQAREGAIAHDLVVLAGSGSAKPGVEGLQRECPLWVKSGHSSTVLPIVRFAPIADILPSEWRGNRGRDEAVPGQRFDYDASEA
jgi:hypothetical protein